MYFYLELILLPIVIRQIICDIGQRVLIASEYEYISALTKDKMNHKKKKIHLFSNIINSISY